MARGKEYTNILVNDNNKIINIVNDISPKMADYINNTTDSNFLLFYKYINHSDLPTFGKALKKSKIEKNILYYLTIKEMQKLKEENEHKIKSAHQSSISLSEEFYKKTVFPKPRDKENYKFNDFCNVYLVNENLEFFSSEYTKKILEKLEKLNKLKNNRKENWDFNKLDIELNTDDWKTPIQVSCSVHGFGMSSDEQLHKLRHHIFKGDTFILIYEEKHDERNLYILLEKNPAFYTILGIANKTYSNYLTMMRKKNADTLQLPENAISAEQINQEDEITRQKQSKWRTMLAKEMMGYTLIDEQVFCPFTYITANFNELGALFVASHIKGFKDPNTTNEEKYDLNNGLLLCANADALFDKHLISVDENKNLVFSFTLTDPVLKQRLCLTQTIFQDVLNDKRMEYLKYHKAEFDKLEKERMQG